MHLKLETSKEWTAFARSRQPKMSDKHLVILVYFILYWVLPANGAWDGESGKQQQLCLFSLSLAFAFCPEPIHFAACVPADTSSIPMDFLVEVSFFSSMIAVDSYSELTHI